MYKLILLTVLLTNEVSFAVNRRLTYEYSVFVGDDALVVINKPDACRRCIFDTSPLNYISANITDTDVLFAQNRTDIILDIRDAFYGASKLYSFETSDTIITVDVVMFAMNCFMHEMKTVNGQYIIGIRYVCSITSRARLVSWLEDGNSYGKLGLKSYETNKTTYTIFRNGRNNSVTDYQLRIHPAVYEHSVNKIIDFKFEYKGSTVLGGLNYSYIVEIIPIPAELCDNLRLTCDDSDDVILRKSFDEITWSVFTTHRTLSIFCITSTDNAYYKCGRDNFRHVYKLNATSFSMLNRKDINLRNSTFEYVRHEYSDSTMILSGILSGVVFMIVLISLVIIVRIKIRIFRLHNNYVSMAYRKRLNS